MALRGNAIRQSIVEALFLRKDELNGVIAIYQGF
jgi:hypothetical protein